MFPIILTVRSDYCPKHQSPVGFCDNDRLSLLRVGLSDRSCVYCLHFALQHVEMRRAETREKGMLFCVTVREVSRGPCSPIAQYKLRNLKTALL